MARNTRLAERKMMFQELKGRLGRTPSWQELYTYRKMKPVMMQRVAPVYTPIKAKPAWYRKLWWLFLGRCSECGSKNIKVWSVEKAWCEKCGAEN